MTEKLADVAPEGTVIEADEGAMVAALDEIESNAPLPGAGFNSVAVHRVLMYGVRVVDAHSSVVTRTGAVIDIARECVDPLTEAMRVRFWSEETAAAVAVKVVVVAPAATITVDGTDRAEASVLTSVTAVPPLGAGRETATVQVAELDAVRLVEPQVSDETDITPVTVNVSDLLEEPRVAVRIGFWLVVIAFAVATKAALVAPDATSTEAGAVSAAVMLLASTTVVPPAGAALEMVTVQLVVADGTSETLLHDRELTESGAVTEIDTDRVLPLRVAVTFTV